MDCTYCGEPADTRDHIVPSLYADRVRSFADAKNLTPACMECNKVAGSKYFGEGSYGVRAKAAYLSGWYTRKYRKILATTWTGEEIKRNLRGNLRKLVAAKQMKRTIMEDRIAHLSLVAISFDADIETAPIGLPGSS